jgi:hypothetical protein
VVTVSAMNRPTGVSNFVSAQWRLHHPGNSCGYGPSRAGLLLAGIVKPLNQRPCATTIFVPNDFRLRRGAGVARRGVADRDFDSAKPVLGVVGKTVVRDGPNLQARRSRSRTN